MRVDLKGNNVTVYVLVVYYKQLKKRQAIFFSSFSSFVQYAKWEEHPAFSNAFELLEMRKVEIEL